MKMILEERKISSKMFISYLAVFMVPLFFMGMFCYSWMSGIMHQQTELSYVASLKQARDFIQQRLSQLDNFSYSMANTQLIQKMAYMQGNTIDYTRVDNLVDFLNSLNSYKAINGLVEDLSIYLPDKDMVLSSDGMASLEWYFSYKYGLSVTNTDKWVSIFKNMSAFFSSVMIGPEKAKNYAFSENVYIYLKTLPLMSERPLAVLIAVINESKINEMLEKIKLTDYTSIYVFGKDKELVTSLNSDDEMKEIIESNIENRDEIGKSIYLADSKGKKYLLYYLENDDNSDSWNYAVAVPENEILGRILFIKKVTIIVCSVLFALGVLFSYGIAFLNYKPIKNIVKIIRERFNPGNVQFENEYKLIENGIRNSYGQEDGLLEMMKNYNIYVLGDCFRRVLCGRVNDVNEEYINEIIKNGFCKELFTVVVFDAENAGNGLPEKITSDSWSTYILKQNVKITAIINSNNNEQIISDAVQYITNGYFGPNASAGIGRPYKLGNLWRSYNEAETALSCKMLKSSGSLIYFNDISTSGDKKYFYPIFHMEELKKHVKDDNYAILRKLMIEATGFYADMSRLPLSIERYHFFKIAEVATQELTDEYLKSIIDFHKEELADTVTVNEFQSGFEKLLKDICNVALKQDNKFSSGNDREIARYIDENYYDPSLSLSKLAEYFNMSMPHMSKYFKERMKENYIDYLAKVRITVAKKLLADENLSIEQAGLQVGYDCVKTFRRAFKKYENLTPGQYKETAT